MVENLLKKSHYNLQVLKNIVRSEFFQIFEVTSKLGELGELWNIEVR